MHDWSESTVGKKSEMWNVKNKNNIFSLDIYKARVSMTENSAVSFI